MQISLLAGAMLVSALTAPGHSRPIETVDWQYCLAPSQSDSTVYVTPTFRSQGDIGAADRIFENTLKQAGAHYDSVQCPRADDERTIDEMQQYALGYNRSSGRAIVRVPLDGTR